MKAKQYQIVKNEDGTFGAIVTEVELADEEVVISPIEQIESCKAQLSATDYKVTKNAECLTLGLELPYNAEELHKERQALRDRINALEREL